MSFNPSDSAIKVDQSLEARIAAATSQAQVSQILREAARDQRLVVPDAYDPNVLLPVEPGTAPRKCARVVTIDGTKHVLEADSELALEKAESDLYRTALEQPAAEHAAPVQRENLKEDLDAAAQAELRMRMVRGELSPEDFLAQSGEIEKYLAAKGIDVDALRETSQAAAGKNLERSWSEATEAFLKSPEGQSWPGGEANLNRIGEILVDNDLVDAEDKLDALRQAAEFMRKENLFVENPETKIADAKSSQELQRALDSFRPRGGSSLFGR